VLLGEVDLYANATRLNGQAGAETTFAPGPPCGDLVEEVGRDDAPVLEFWPDMSGQTQITLPGRSIQRPLVGETRCRPSK
jgi:hypothetical protein